MINFGQNNKWGGCDERGSWQKSPKLINGEVGINGEAGKNTASRNFIEKKIIKRSCENISKKNIRNTKILYLHEESLANLRLYLLLLINVMLIKKHVYQTILWLSLGFTLPLSTVHMN